MDARWMPLLAAAVGVLGGVGGAYIGGVVANEGQEQQSNSERAAAIQDLRIDMYGDYLGDAEALAGTLSVPLSEKERYRAYVTLLSAEARVSLIAEHPAVLGTRAEAISKAVSDEDVAAYEKATRSFLAAARDEIAESGN